MDMKIKKGLLDEEMRAWKIGCGNCDWHVSLVECWLENLILHERFLLVF